jgi:hypothetical protein
MLVVKQLFVMIHYSLADQNKAQYKTYYRLLQSSRAMRAFIPFNDGVKPPLQAVFD